MSSKVTARLGSPTQRRTVVTVGVAALLAVTAVAALTGEPGELNLADAIVLGVVEGITEYLPVSSTGHLAVTQRLLGVATEGGSDNAAADAYAIAIQLGAILAVLGLYRDRITSMARGVVGRDEEGRGIAIAVFVAFLPAAAVGLLLGDAIKAQLFGIWPIVAAWAVGGLAILVLAPRLSGGRKVLEVLTLRDAAVIGAAQILALWPGTSRSLVTILAALAIGASVRTAVEFSFLLGLLTLGAATVYESLGQGGLIIEEFGLLMPLVGVVASFASAVVAVRWLVEFLNRRPLTVFGWYRIAIAVVVGALALTPLL